MIRKHSGINQKTGRLKKGFRYTGRTLKSGLKEIKQVKSKFKGTCKQHVGYKIGKNMKEGKFKSKAQAIAVSFSQVSKERPKCKKILQKNKKKKIIIKKKIIKK